MTMFTTSTTLEAALPPLDASTLHMGGARQRIRLMRSTLKLGRSSSATAGIGASTASSLAQSPPHSRSHSPAPSYSSVSSVLTTTTKIETLPIGPKRNIAHGVTHRRTGSGPGSGSESHGPSHLRRHGSVFTGLHLTLVDDDPKNDLAHSNRGHGYNSSVSSTSTVYTTTSELPPTRSFAGRRSKDSPHGSPRPKPLALSESAHDENRSQPQAHPRPKRQSRRQSTSESHSEPTSKSNTPMPTPLTPSFRFIAPAIPEMRKLKLDKLARQLGENIPPELVFKPNDLNANVSMADSKHSKSVEHADGASRSSTSEWAGMEVKSRRRSMSVDHSQHPSVQDPSPQPRKTGLLAHLPKSIPVFGAKWEAPDSWSGPPEEAERRGSNGLGAKEPWMGIWNAEDHDDVMRKLRAL